MLRIYLDVGSGPGRWVDMPASPEELKEAGNVLAESAYQNQYAQIGDVESSVFNLSNYLRGHM